MGRNLANSGVTLKKCSDENGAIRFPVTHLP